MEIKADDLFDSEFDKCVDYALLEFGRKTAKKWIDGLIGIKHQLRLMPECYPFVPELQKWRKYRGAIIMKNFKIIDFYNEEKDILWLVDLWDLRQELRVASPFQPYYRRENQEDAYRLENAIQHDAASCFSRTIHRTSAKGTLNIRYVEEQEQDDGADPECTFHLDPDAMENTG